MTIQQHNDTAVANDHTGWSTSPQATRHRLATLVPDLEHPFFFDHPIDHVPGIQMVAGLLDLVEDTAGPHSPEADRQVTVSLTFTQFAELDEQLTLQVVRDDDSWALTATQHGRLVCRGTVATTRLRRIPLPEVMPLRRTVLPAPGPLVHRHHQRNIMVGVLAQPRPGVFTAAVLPSEAFGPSGRFRRPVEIIEAARQLSLMLGHVAHERATQSQVVWLETAADIPVAIPIDLPLDLCWHQAPTERIRSQARYEFELAVPGTDLVLGKVSCVMHTVSQPAYRKLRLAKAAA